MMEHSTAQCNNMPSRQKNSYHLVSLEDNNTSTFISSSQQLTIGIKLNTRYDVRYKYSQTLPYFLPKQMHHHFSNNY